MTVRGDACGVQVLGAGRRVTFLACRPVRCSQCLQALQCLRNLLYGS